MMDATPEPTNDSTPGVPGVPALHGTPEVTSQWDPSNMSAVQASQTRGWRKGVALVGVIGLVGGGAFAARQFAASPSNTPTEAVQEFLSALSSSDVIGAMETLAPGERNLMLDTAVPLIDELKRLDVIDPANDLHKLSSASVKFTGQAFAEQPVRDDIITVQMTGGSIETSADPAKILGGVVKQFAESVPAQQKHAESFKQGSLTTVKRDGRWYVSLAYSAAEAARRSSGKPMPTAAESITAVGANSPEEAVQQMMNRLGALDTKGAIALLDPDEMQVMQDYAPLFLADTEATLAKARKQFTLSFPKLGLQSKQVDGQTVVSITRWSVDLNVNADGTSAHVVLDGDCVDATYNAKQSKRCGKDLPKLIGDLTGDTESGKLAEEQWTKQYQKMLTDPASSGGLTVVQRGGKWFVAPIRTTLGSVVTSLRKIKPEDLKGTGNTPEERLSSLMDNPLFGQLSQPFGAILGGGIGGPVGSGGDGFPIEQPDGAIDRTFGTDEFPVIELPDTAFSSASESVPGNDSTVLFEEPTQTLP